MEQFPIAKIIVGNRLRDADPRDVAVIAESIKTEGQLQPILVRKIGAEARLVSGLHRLEAFKLLGRDTIGVTWLPLTGDDELDDLNEGIAECDENMRRVELDGIRPIFTERRTLLTAKRISKQALDAAVKAEAEAKAAKAAAKTEAEKAEAAKAVDAARKARERADKTVRKVQPDRTESGPTGPKTVHDLGSKLPKGALDAVRDEVGLSSTTIRHDLALIRNFGHEVLTLADRVKLGTDKASSKAEMAALKKLKTQFPEAYDHVIASWRRAVTERMYYAKRPSTILRDEYARQQAETKKAAGILADLRELQNDIATTRQSVIAVRNRIMSMRALDFKTALSDLRAISERLEALRQLTSAIHTAEKIKIEGIR